MVKSVAELGLQLKDAGSINDLLGAAYDLDGLLIQEADLSPEFFDLKTGLLGELFQKLVNYRKVVAVVIPNAAAHGPRFAELAYEHATHPQVRFFVSAAEAWTWLLAGG